MDKPNLLKKLKLLNAQLNTLRDRGVIPSIGENLIEIRFKDLFFMSQSSVYAVLQFLLVNQVAERTPNKSYIINLEKLGKLVSQVEKEIHSGYY